MTGTYLSGLRKKINLLNKLISYGMRKRGVTHGL
jgi:hypothetical protein